MMTDNLRTLLALLAGIFILIVVHFTIGQRERIVADGHVVLLRLAPVDPRSLMQGDYMALRFAIADELGSTQKSGSNYVILVLDEHDVGIVVGVDDGSPLGESQLRMRYRVGPEGIRFASDAFFFAEGTEDVYEVAEFGEFRVDESGEAILTHLRDGNFKRLGKGAFDE